MRFEWGFDAPVSIKGVFFEFFVFSGFDLPDILYGKGFCLLARSLNLFYLMFLEILNEEGKTGS